MDCDTTNNLPVEAKLVSSDWKLRAAAYEELSQRLEARDLQLLPLLRESLPKMLAESVPSAIEKGLALATLCLGEPEALLGRDQPQPDLPTKQALKSLLEKVLALNRPNLSSNSSKLLCALHLAGDRSQAAEAICESLANKNIKVQVASVNAVRDLLVHFGPKHSQAAQFLQKILSKAADPHPEVRNACMDFLKELSKWQAEALLPLLKPLKQVQIEEIKSFIASFKQETGGRPPLPKLSVEPALPAAAPGSLQAGLKATTAAPSQADAENDLWEQLEPARVLHKFPEAWCDKVLAESKWTEKKLKLELLDAALNVPKIELTQFGHITKMLKKLLNESSIPVHMVCLTIIKKLCKALRGKFSLGVKSLNRTLLIKLKDRKPLVTEALVETVAGSFQCVALEEVIDEYKDILKEKNPQTKHLILKLLHQQLTAQTKKCLASANVVKTILACSKENLSDGSPEVRKVSMELIAEVVRGLPRDTGVQRELNSIEEKKRAKIVEMAQEEKTDPNSPQQAKLKDSRPSSEAKRPSSVSKYPVSNPQNNHSSGKKSTPQVQVNSALGFHQPFANKVDSKPLPQKPILKKSNSIAVIPGQPSVSSLVEEFKTCVGFDEACLYLTKE